MSENLKKYVESKKQPPPTHNSPEDKKAIASMMRDAKKAGSELQPGAARGGLKPALALAVYRRDKWKCHVCGKPGKIKGKDANGGLSLHHKAGDVSSKRMSNLGHANKKSALVSICVRCHDKTHDKSRAKGEDSPTQVLAKGDRGNPKYDHGQPLARPKN